MSALLKQSLPAEDKERELSVHTWDLSKFWYNVICECQSVPRWWVGGCLFVSFRITHSALILLIESTNRLSAAKSINLGWVLYSFPVNYNLLFSGKPLKVIQFFLIFFPQLLFLRITLTPCQSKY